MLLHLIFITCCAATLFPNDEIQVILSSLRLLKIGKCIIVTETEERFVGNEIKRLNKNFILTGFMRRENLSAYLKELKKPPDARTAIVIKAEKTSDVSHLLTEHSNLLVWFVWFLLSNDDLDKEIRIPFNCQFFQIEKGKGRTMFLFENYHIKNSSIFRKKFGEWSPGRGLTTRSLNMFERRKDFEGLQLKVRLCLRHEYEIAIHTFWMDSAKFFNFSLKTYDRSLRGNLSLKDPDGSTCIWGITKLDLDVEWVFLSSGIRAKLAAKFRSSNDIGWKAYVQPFKTDLWMAVGLWLLLSTFAIIFTNGCTLKTLYLNIFTAFFCLCNSDPSATYPSGEPIPLKTKLVYLMVVAVPSVIVPAYSAYILSTLSIALPLEPFNNLEGLIADGTYKVTGVNNTFAIRYFKSSQDPVLKYVHDHLFVDADALPVNFSTLYEELCRNPRLAGFFLDIPTFRKRFHCRMFVMSQEVMTINTGLRLPKGSPFRRLINERIFRYFETAILYRRHFVPEDVLYQAAGEETNNPSSLSMSHVRPIFLLIPLGVLMSILVLTIEKLVKTICSSRQ